MSESVNPRERRRITVEVSATLYAAIMAAKVFSRRSINDLTREGLELMAARYRDQRRAARLPSVDATPTDEGAAS